MPGPPSGENEASERADIWYSQYERAAGLHGSIGDSLNYFMRLFEDAPAAYLVTDANLIITDANAAAQRLFGRAISALKGKPLSLLVGSSDRETFRRIITGAVREAQAPISRPLKLMIASGEAELNFSAAVLRDSDQLAESISWIFYNRHESPDDFL